MKYFEYESCIFSMFVLLDRYNFVLIQVNWLTNKMLISCFISRSFSSWIMKCYISGTIYKIVIFWKSNCCVCGNMRKIATLWNSDCYICGNIYKIATFLLKVLLCLGNLQIWYKLCKIKTLQSAPPEPIHSCKYTGVTGLFKFVVNI